MEIFKKKCTCCSEIKNCTDFYKNSRAKDGYAWMCKACADIYRKNYLLKNSEKIKAYNVAYDSLHPNRKSDYYLNTRLQRKNKRLQLEFGITLNDYNFLSEQQNHLCAICGKPETEVQKGKTPKTLSVDHNHSTNKVRGLLCQKCNKGIGMFLENIDILKSAITYLEKHNVSS